MRVARKRRYRLARAKCPRCERTVACSAPPMATDDVFHTHKNVDGERCDNSRMPVDAENYVADFAGWKP